MLIGRFPAGSAAGERAYLALRFDDALMTYAGVSSDRETAAARVAEPFQSSRS